MILQQASGDAFAQPQASMTWRYTAVRWIRARGFARQAMLN